MRNTSARKFWRRSRRGKRHRARRGEVAVLGGAPYGYRYHKKTPDSDAFYEIVEPQASVVRDVYRYYTRDHMSIGAIARKLNERAVLTSSGGSRWERSVVWAMLRNPAYKGRACFGKTRIAPRQRVTRPLRQRDGFASRNSASHERLREDWIEIPVPAIVSEHTFDLAEERLQQNKAFSRRKTRTPSVLQGLVGMRQMRLWAVPHVGPDQCPQDLLLPLPGFRFLAPSPRPAVRQPSRAPGSAR